MTSTFDVLAQVCVLIEKKIKSGGHTGEFVFRLALRGRSSGGVWGLEKLLVRWPCSVPAFRFRTRPGVQLLAAWGSAGSAGTSP